MEIEICVLNENFSFQKQNYQDEAAYCVGSRKTLVFNKDTFYTKTTTCDFFTDFLDNDSWSLEDYNDEIEYKHYTKTIPIDINQDFLCNYEDDLNLFFLNRYILNPEISLQLFNVKANNFDFDWELESQIEFKKRLILDKIPSIKEDLHDFFVVRARYDDEGKKYYYYVEKSFFNHSNAISFFDECRNDLLKNNIKSDEDYLLIQVS